MFAREIWSQLESVHAVTYFTSESLEAARAAELSGFWMGYFGFRASPLGPVDAGAIEATFANFAPAMVRRDIPDAWSYADPSDLVRIRARAAASALRRTSSQIEQAAAHVNDDLEAVIACATTIGHPLFAANRDIDRLDDPVERLVRPDESQDSWSRRTSQPPAQSASAQAEHPIFASLIGDRSRMVVALRAI